MEFVMVEGGLFIGKVAKRAGMNPRTISYYEAIGLLPTPQRGHNRYRIYSADAVEMLQFIRKAQGLGFRLSEIKGLVELRRTGQQPCVRVQTLAERKIADLDERLKDLAALRENLKALVSRSKRQGGQGNIKAVVCPHIESLPPGLRPQEQSRRNSHVSRKTGSPTSPPTSRANDRIRIWRKAASRAAFGVSRRIVRTAKPHRLQRLYWKMQRPSLKGSPTSSVFEEQHGPGRGGETIRSGYRFSGRR